MAKKPPEPPPIEPREFRSSEEIEAGIIKLERRVKEVQELSVHAAVVNDTGAIDVVRSNMRESIREIFGTNSPEFIEHQHLDIWAGALFLQMDADYVIQCRERGRAKTLGILKGLIARLNEKRADLAGTTSPTPSTYFGRLNLHPRIRDVSRELFLDGHHWEAVFAAAKALVNYVKERSGRHDLDGAPLVRAVFSKNAPVLSFNDLANQVDLDEQEGTMHLIEGAVLALRNPGGHAFPEGPEQRAVEYISLLSLLAYRVQESKRRKTS